METSREARFQAVLASSRRRLARIARAYAPGADAQDLYQEILLQIWRGLERFAGRASPDTWAYRVALNTAITWKRREAVRPPIAQPSPDSEIAAERVGDLEGRDPLVILDEFLASIGKADRALITALLMALGLVVGAVIYWMNQEAARRELHPLREEVAGLLRDLESNGVSSTCPPSRRARRWFDLRPASAIVVTDVAAVFQEEP
jgi:RNA polymerase sigma-70 factor (ECF subfamily)